MRFDENITLAQIFWFADYLRYLWNSRSRHGTHSPFIYSFADEVLYQKGEPLCIDLIELERSKYLRLTNNTYQQIPQRKHLTLLYRYLHWNGTVFSNFLEIGSSLNTLPSIIYEVDPSVNGISISVKEIMTITEDSYLPKLETVQMLNKSAPIHCDYLKSIGFMEKEIMDIQGMDYLIQLLSPNGLLILNRLDDFWGQKDAWDLLIRHPRVTANINLFKMGMIFVRKEQQKETFTLRY
jgi:hypothetical protein